MMRLYTKLYTGKPHVTSELWYQVHTNVNVVLCEYRPNMKNTGQIFAALERDKGKLVRDVVLIVF